MISSNNKTASSQRKVIAHQTNDTKTFEFNVKDGKLMILTIYHPSGHILNETRLLNGKMISYKIFEEVERDSLQTDGDTPEITSKLEHEIQLGEDNILNYCRFYDLTSSKLSYEGGFVDGKKSGCGKKFYDSGNVLYDGNWLNDNMSGEGTLYHENGNIKYNGHFQKGKKNGHGKSFFANGNKSYEGRYCMNMIIGDAKVFHSNGSLHMTGKFDYNFFKGICFNENTIKEYEGEMNFNSETEEYVKQGNGTNYWPNGHELYAGEWKANKLDGYGSVFYNNGVVNYNGQFIENLYHGFGSKHDVTGILMCEGQWKDGKLDSINLTDRQQQKGYQIKHLPDRIFVGELRNGNKTGYGEYYFRNTGLRFFEGNFEDDIYNGLCKQYFNKTIQTNNQAINHIGYKLNDKWHGRLYFYDKNGKFMYRVFNENSKYIDKFRVSYKKNGELDFANSYKGELYLQDDFRREQGLDFLFWSEKF